jgi:hypothetical protein
MKTFQKWLAESVEDNDPNNLKYWVLAKRFLEKAPVARDHLTTMADEYAKVIGPEISSQQIFDLPPEELLALYKQNQL